MNFLSYLGDGLRMLAFNTQAQTRAQTESSLKHALVSLGILLAISFVFSYWFASAFPAPWGTPDPLGVALFVTVATLIITFVLYGLVHLSAFMLRGTGTFRTFFIATMPVVFWVYVLSILVGVARRTLPVLEWLSTLLLLYECVIVIWIMKRTYEFTLPRAIAAFALPFVVLALVVAVIL